WVGTPDGAAHFDGKEFTLWNAPASLQRATVYALRQDQRGVIWACTSMGLARFDGKEWTLRYSAKHGFFGDGIPLAQTFDSSGRMWVASPRGVLRLGREHFVPVSLPNGTSLGETDDILAETNGTIWFASWDRGVFRWNGEQIQPVPVPPAFAGSRAHR